VASVQGSALISGRTSPPRRRLTIVIVNYESWAETVRLVGSLLAEPEAGAGDCEVVVVDNDSSGTIPDIVSDPRPGLRLIVRPDNGGFAAGVNAGWQSSCSPWYLILNPDVEIGAGFIRRVFDRLDDYESRPEGIPGIAGFGLKNPDGSPQGSVGAFPSLARSIREQFIPRSRRKYQPAWHLRPGLVDWVTGACMLVNAGVVAATGGMDEDFFLYHEEVAFCRVARLGGWRVEFDPGVEIVHRHPLQNRPISPKMRVITRHSKLLYFRKHLPRWQFHALAAFIGLEAAVRGPWSLLRGRGEEARAWRTIARIAERLRRGEPVQGGEVRILADTLSRSAVSSGASTRVDGPSGSRGTAEANELHAHPARRPRRARRSGGKPIGR
jgi:N-acetylglucosaminyl-diphospho-decaprenol L-rhamnosyltransferase